ncbi:tetratricopeptide repeat protein [Flavobacterium facile]|uniref:tetratricopeptide repeat protein n=1 Tax=Flavobacterium facile TaxID=2893174 RepID=UPI002E7A42FD|nr:tetratricopeptide repeat protein [Flavobacterium sp. T-12]
MKIAYLFFLYFSCPFFAFSQGSTIEIDKMQDQAENVLKSNIDGSLVILNSSLSKASLVKYDKGEARAYWLIGLTYYYKSDFKKSTQFLNVALLKLKTINGAFEYQANCYRVLGKIALHKGNFSEAYENLLKAKDYYGKTVHLIDKDSRDLVNNDIAYYYIQLNNYDKALLILNGNLKNKSLSRNTLADTFLLFSIISNSQSDFVESIEYYNKALKIYQSLNDKVGVISCETNIAIAYYDLKKYKKSIVLFEEILDESKSAGIAAGEMKSNLYLANCFIEINDLKTADHYIKIVEKLIKKISGFEDDLIVLKSKRFIATNEITKSEYLIEKHIASNKNIPTSAIIDFYGILELAYKKENNFQKAYEFQLKRVQFKDEINNANLQENINSQRVEFKYDNLKNELAIQTKDYEILRGKEKNQKTIIIAVFLISALIILLMIFYFNKKKKMFHLKESVALSEKKILEVINLKKEREIEFKNKEITDFAIHISEKNEILEDIKNKIKELQLKDSKTQNKITELVLFINDNINQNAEKVKLYSEIQQTTDSFYQKLTSVFPGLTEKETRLASLVMLQLSSKQIAQQLNIAPASIDNYRSILRKKMDIPKEQSLQDFLKNLS